eukprot:TRINITY_DN2569_c1_g1_i1.p1 TRINITY_DN2569_c1_g1~~TRINITY_DN2569_c1_g1_i1.p1  ORF type:complete len:1561 (+),score=259.41 TRINITY_DN2569_c1_g1_i1:318-4685(+)
MTIYRGVKSWNLDYDYFQQVGETGDWTVTQDYTHCYWVHWRKTDGERSLFGGDANSGFADISVNSKRELGMISKGSFKGTGKTVSISDWNFVCVAGSSIDRTSEHGTSTFFMAGPNDEEPVQFGNAVNRVISGNSVFRIGGPNKGPGRIVMAQGWDRVLLAFEFRNIFDKTVTLVQGAGVAGLTALDANEGDVQVEVDDARGMEAGDYLILGAGETQERNRIKAVSMLLEAGASVGTEQDGEIESDTLTLDSPVVNWHATRSKVVAYKVAPWIKEPTHWLAAPDFEVKPNRWRNRGTQGVIDNVVTTGAVTKTASSGFGAAVSIEYIMGVQGTQLSFGKLAAFGELTMCALTRYTGPVSKRGRILNGGGNWLFGHHNRRAGVIHVNEGGWITPEVNRKDNNWLAMCARSGTSVKDVLVDGESIGNTKSFGPPKEGEIVVNQAGVHGGSASETSEFAIAEILIWDSADPKIIKQGMEYLTSILTRGRQGTPFGCGPRVSAPPLPRLWLVAEDYSPTTDKWPNRGYGKQFIDVVRSGGLAKEAAAGFGAEDSIFYLKGSKDTSVYFGNIMTSEQWTLCVLSRYTGGVKGRILVGSGEFALGHVEGKEATMKTDSGWTVDKGGRSSTNWVVMCARNGGGSGSVKYNGQSLNVRTAPKLPSGGELGINVNARSFCCGSPAKDERSDFAISEIMLWDSDNVDAGGDYLLQILRMGRSLQCGPQPTTMDLVAVYYGGGSKIVDISGVVWRLNKAVTTSFPGVVSWDLENDFFEQVGTDGEWTVTKQYTHCYWIKWRQSDSGWRTLFRGNSDHAVIVYSGSRTLGMYSNRLSGWRSTGKNVDISKWNFLCVVGQGKTDFSPEGTSTMWVGTTGDTEIQRFGNRLDRVASGTTVYRMGWAGQAPGKLNMMKGWDRALGQTEMNALFEDTKNLVGGSKCCDKVPKGSGTRYCRWVGDPHFYNYIRQGGAFHPRHVGTYWILKNNYWWVQSQFGPRYPSITLSMAFSGYMMNGNVLNIMPHHWHRWYVKYNGNGWHSGWNFKDNIVHVASANSRCINIYWPAWKNGWWSRYYGVVSHHHGRYYHGDSQFWMAIPPDSGSTIGFCNSPHTYHVSGGDNLYHKRSMFSLLGLNQADGPGGDNGEEADDEEKGENGNTTNTTNTTANEGEEDEAPINFPCDQTVRAKANKACESLRPEDGAHKDEWADFVSCVFDVCATKDEGFGKEHKEDAAETQKEARMNTIVNYKAVAKDGDCPEDYKGSSPTSTREEKEVDKTIEDAGGADEFKACEPESRKLEMGGSVARTVIHEADTCGKGMQPAMPKAAADLTKLREFVLENAGEELTSTVYLGGHYDGEAQKWSWDDGSKIDIFGDSAPEPEETDKDNYLCMKTDDEKGDLIACNVAVTNAMNVPCETKFFATVEEEEAEDDDEEDSLASENDGDSKKAQAPLAETAVLLSATQQVITAV